MIAWLRSIFSKVMEHICQGAIIRYGDTDEFDVIDHTTGKRKE